MRCSRCGTELPADARFCSSCGAPVAGLPAAEERKFVSVLFVDVVGSTAHADGADPEDVRDRNQMLLPGGPRPDRTARRDDREVRRRCGDGRVRGAARAERRCGASRACGDQHPRGHRGVERTRSEPRPPGARRCLHGRGDRLHRRRARRRARDGRRGEHSRPAAVRGTDRSRRRRRRDLPPHTPCVRLPGARGRRREGQARSGAGVARGAFARGARGATDVDDAARRSGPRGAVDPNRVGSCRHRGIPARRHRGRPRRDRQVAIGRGDRRRDRGARRAQPVGTEPAVRGADAVPRVRPDPASGGGHLRERRRRRGPAEARDARGLRSSPKARRPMPRATSR